jgi:hypothetical protein
VLGSEYQSRPVSVAVVALSVICLYFCLFLRGFYVVLVLSFVRVFTTSYSRVVLYDSFTFGGEELNRNAKGTIGDHTDLSRFLSTAKIYNNEKIYLKDLFPQISTVNKTTKKGGQTNFHVGCMITALPINAVTYTMNYRLIYS